MWSDVIYYVFSVLAVVLFVGSIQFKKKKDILLAQSFSSLCYVITYGMVGAYSGALTEFIEQIKSILFYHYEKNNRKIPLLLLIVFVLSLIVIAVFTYNGFYTLIPLIINLAYFYSSYLKNPKYIRLIVLICGFIWIYYNITVHAYIFIIGNIFEIISGSIALIRYRKK